MSENLLIGAYQTTSGVKGRYFTGVIHRFDIRKGVMTESERTTWFESNGETN